MESELTCPSRTGSGAEMSVSIMITTRSMVMLKDDEQSSALISHAGTRSDMAGQGS